MQFIELTSIPVRQFLDVAHFHSHQRIVRAGILASGTTPLIGAQITFGRFDNRCMLLVVADEVTTRVTHFDHANGIVGAIVSTATAADTSLIVDDDLSFFD